MLTRSVFVFTALAAIAAWATCANAASLGPLPRGTVIFGTNSMGSGCNLGDDHYAYGEATKVAETVNGITRMISVTCTPRGWVKE
jgi:hypothetical protein